jgi:cathepsin A (carboxypeptidase C)
MKALLISIFLISSLFAADIFLNEDHHPGFITVTEQGDDLFYWLFKSRNDKANDPLVFWLTGGPGCSSVLAVFTENGPFHVGNDLNLTKNVFSWNEEANVVFVDQPVGTGYSKGSVLDYATSEDVISSDFYVFLKGFLNTYPEYRSRPMFITGESYAGHYIPAIASYIHQQNNSDVNLVGVAIGNGWVDPYLQYPAYNTFALENNLIGKVQYYLLEAAFTACQGLIDTGIWLVAMEECQLAVTTILGIPLAPRFNVYDIRKKCDYPPLCYDFSPVENFLKRADVIESLGVQGRSWESCNMAVHTALLGDWVNDLSNKVTYLLNNHVNVLVYSGNKDFICNWRGGEAWTNGLEWPHAEEFRNASYVDWKQGNATFGQMKVAENLVFLKVYDAGHMVPMDQPEAALDMLNRFIKTWAFESKQNKNEMMA